jgi:hypothetical protein
MDEARRPDYLPQPDDERHPFAEALRTGQARLMADLDAWLFARSASHEALIAQLAPRAVLLAPLKARARVLGVITCAAVGPERGYTQADLLLVQELARRPAWPSTTPGCFAKAQTANRRARRISLRRGRTSSKRRSPTCPVLPRAPCAGWSVRARLEPERLARALQANRPTIGQAAHLVGQLLDVARIQAGRLLLERQPTELCALVRGLAAAAQARTKQHTFEVGRAAGVLGAGRPAAFGAGAYQPHRQRADVQPGTAGSVVIGLTRARGSHAGAKLRSRTTGLAYRPSTAPTFSTAFTRRTTSAVRAGWGSGFTSAAEIVELHGGRIAAEFPPDGGDALCGEPAA